MKSLFVLLVSASALVVGCAGSSPLAPDVTSASSARSIAASSAGSNGPRTFLPPINPANISCPSDAPQIVVTSLNLRMDIEFSEVTGANAYEIEIVNYYGEVTLLVIPAPAHRAEWHGTPNFYSVRVRTQNCGGTGKWSAYAYKSLPDGGVLPAPELPIVPPPSEEPECEEGCEPPPPPVHCMMGCF
jgi:hypothetical protein